MPRTVLTCALLAVLVRPCGAADQANPPSETRVRLTVSPAPAPRPALRYLLLPEFRELSPGNPCFHYLKCFLGQHRFFFDTESVERREKLLAMPLKDLPVKELRDLGRYPLSQADRGARLDTPDWQVLAQLKIDSFATLLPDVQQMRTLANALKLRFRVEVAERRFEDAVGSAKTIFAMARHLGEHPTLMGNLAGFAIANLAISPLEEMLEQPGCPNLYWALTNLPHPLVTLDKGLGGERDIFLGFLNDLDGEAPMSEDRLQKFLAPLDRVLSGHTPLKPGDVRAWMNSRTSDERVVRAARRRLVEYGLPEERVARFPAEQVILLDEKREYEIRRDDILKLMNLPMVQAIPLVAQIKPDKERALFADPFLEAMLVVNRPQARLDQRIGLLRHVEALRMYAAEHDGALPRTLSDLPVPLSVDPFTGNPFRYEVKGDTAHLHGSPPPGEEKNPVYNVHYEVTLRK